VKALVGFCAGVIVCGIVLLGLVSAMPIRAQIDSSDNVTDNLSLTYLLPDIEKIYQEALTSPFYEARKKIYDEDIASYYDQLLERASLNRVEEGAED